ncbi:MAG: ParB N-terminal domain-containing protein [Patescibacteria group bacterium]|jgi:ParB-like chromosome segregation protein Spo0J
MKQQIVYLKIKGLKPHEEIRPARLASLRRKILADGVFTTPIFVDRKTGVILDGHHRIAAARALGLRKIPAYLINYSAAAVKVEWRKGALPSATVKAIVLCLAARGRLLPPKSTRHRFPVRRLDPAPRLGELR